MKNLLGQAEEQLAEGNLSEDDIRGLLKPVRRLLEDEDFWQPQSDGLAVFLIRTPRPRLEDCRAGLQSKEVDEAKDDYGQALSKGQASADIKQVVRAAQQRRVGTLFVARGKSFRRMKTPFISTTSRKPAMTICWTMQRCKRFPPVGAISSWSQSKCLTATRLPPFTGIDSRVADLHSRLEEKKCLCIELQLAGH